MALPDKTYSTLTMNFRDYAGKPSHTKMRITPASAAAWLADTSTGAVHDLTQAIDAVTDGRLVNVTVTNVGAIVQPDLPSDVPSAANSSVLLIINQETTGERDKGRNRLPARKDSVLGAVNGVINVVTPPTSEITTLIQKYEAIVLSEESKALEVVGMRTPGRSEGV